MRALFLVLLIALLPLRGWAGDAMAVDMLAQPTVAIENVATDAVSTVESHPMHAESAMDSHAQCMEHAPGDMANGHTSHVQGAPVPPHHNNHCTTCQACSAIPVALQAAVPLLPVTLHSVPHYAGPAFASAEPARGFKPPIS
ncbi:MAG: hypothetical protein WA136_08815 [Rhodoferax sp.]